MDTTVKALKALYVAMGGTLTDTYDDICNAAPVSDYAVIPDMINALAKVAASGSGSSLPAVTAANNGEVLKVVNGEWAVAGVVAIEVTANNGGE